MLPTAILWAWAVVAPPAQEVPDHDDPGEAERRVYRAVRTIDPIVIDGKKSEKTWDLAPVDDRFTERQPELGGKPPVRTSLQIAYDDSFLYVFIDAESDPGDVIVRTLRRDNRGIFSDDSVHVKIDPRHTHRNAFSFGVNAEGAQIDSLGLEDGRQFLTEWDGVWQAETVRSDDGYTAEYRIPFVILGIKRAEELSFGFDVSRDHPSRNATYDWRVFIPPRSPMAASQFGDVVGLRNIKGGRAIEYTPYAVARTNFKPGVSLDPRLRPNFASGFDIRVQIGAASYAEGTVNTDFAQVEADEVQVARDRFPLFFPERRPFFINGLDVFNFGRQREAQLFFTRRVGLVGGTPVPILGGAKVYGRTGPVSYGVLAVQTLGSPEVPGRGVEAADPEAIGVGRVRVQATRGLNVGMMALGQHRYRTEDEDTASGGVDAQLIALGGKLQYYGFLAGSFAERPVEATAFDAQDRVLTAGRPATQDVGASAHSFVEYRGLYVRPSVLWLWSDKDFDPALGFYRRPGASRQEGRLIFAPRPRSLGLREIEFGPTYSIETDPSYQRRLGQSANGRLQFNWRNGVELGYQITHFVDDVQNEFDLYLYTVEARRYQGFRNRVNAKTPSRRAVEVEGSYEVLNIFGGLAHQPSAELTTRLGKHFTFRGRYTHLIGRLDQREETFNFGFANGNVDIAFNRRIALDNLLRLDLSPGNERVGVQTRLRWRFLPGSDIFLVYRTDQPLGADQAGLPRREPFHEITVKFTYYLRAIVGG